MLLRDFIKDSARALESLYPASESASLVRILVEDLLGVSATALAVNPMRELAPSDEELLRQALERLLAWEPVQYVTGLAWFYGRGFHVSPAVLIPRQETELLVKEVVDHVKACGPANPRILDLCTGSGCIAWTLAAEIPGSKVTAVDISDAALEVARNQKFDIPSPPSFIRADILSDTIPGEYDIVVSNPPYVRDSERAFMRPNVLDHEPRIALFVPDSDPMLFYRAVARIAEPVKYGAVEINEAFAPEVETVFRDNGRKKTTRIVDLSGKNRHIVFSE